MEFLVVLALTCAVVVLANRSIHRSPWLWYGLACALDGLYLVGVAANFPPSVLRVLAPVVQQGMVATALFVIVMYCGVFSEQSPVRRIIGPIRAELSIMACILALAHCLNYLSSYIGVLTAHIEALTANQGASLVVALVLFALLGVLGITSAKAVKRRMRALTWKNVQRASYVFFGLIFVHEVLILYPAALKGTGSAASTLMASAVVFGLYAVLRIGRFVLDRSRSAQAVAAEELEEEVSRACVG